jgi:peptidoglycan/LPS O-acetylase OafA/YrhL
VPQPTREHQAYRADIDGLRAVAVLSVVGYHALSEFVPGGFVGVDIFFVISGYLITSIIVGSLERSTFTYRDFYARRIRRIFPALIVVLVATWLVGWVRLFPDEYRQLGKHVAGGSGFVSNFILRGEGGYFDNTAETKPLLHLWSLAIEEQFYIVWPLILGFTVRRVASTWIIIAIAIASFSFNLATMPMEPLNTFYSPLSRFWELMIGGLLAQTLRSKPLRFERYREACSLTGLALIGVALATFARWTPYPGWRALLPTIGAFLIIAAGPRAWVNRVVLSNRLAVWFGKISYPLYLWHWPLLAFVYTRESDATRHELRGAIVVASIALAWLTYRFVEKPIRTGTRFAGLSAGVPLLLLATLASVGAVGYLTFAHDGFMSRLGERGTYAASFDDSTPDMRYRTRNHVFGSFREECNFYDFEDARYGHSTNVPRVAIDPTCYTRPADTTRAVFLWGDSHAQDLNAGLREALPRDVALLQVASSGCTADLVESEQETPDYCSRSNQFALSTIRREKPDIVLIAQREGQDAQRLRTIARALKASGVRQVVAVGPVPQWKPDLDKVIAAHYWNDTPDRLIDYLDPATVGLSRALRKSIGPEEPFVFIDLFAKLCDARGCMTFLDGDKREGLMTFDYGHLTPRASSFVGGTLIAPILLKLLNQPPDAVSGTSK